MVSVHPGLSIEVQSMDVARIGAGVHASSAENSETTPDRGKINQHP
jgi:hypothetical protein